MNVLDFVETEIKKAGLKHERIIKKLGDFVLVEFDNNNRAAREFLSKHKRNSRISHDEYLITKEVIAYLTRLGMPGNDN